MQVKILCHMCDGEGKRWDLDENDKPVQLYCEYCDGKGGYWQPVTEEEYEKHFFGLEKKHD